MGFDMNEINLVQFQNRKLNYFSHFQASDQRTFFYQMFLNWVKK